jgi:cyclic pyranopterin phosphate synthase
VGRRLTHLDAEGRAQMVDVGLKAPTLRTAVARGRLLMGEESYWLAKEGDLPKGDLLAAARLAGIMAAKQTPHLVPLCHPVMLTHVGVDFDWNDSERALSVEAKASAKDMTGVEMEAMTACCVACLTLYDMVKGVDKGAVIGPIMLTEKTGGKSGRFRR